MSVACQVCQKAIRCVSRMPDVSANVSECCKVCHKVIRCVRRFLVSLGHQVSCGKRLLGVEKVVGCVRRSSGLSEGPQLCQKVFMCVIKFSGVSKGCQVYQKAVRYVRRTLGNHVCQKVVMSVKMVSVL